MLKLTIASQPAVVPSIGELNGAQVETWYDREGVLHAYGRTVRGKHCLHWPGVGSFQFSSHTDEVTATAEPSVGQEVIVDTYYRTVLPLALQARGQEVLHASAILMPRGVVGLCGHSWSGKSTFTYGLSKHGYPVWADDAVRFEASERGIQALPLPFFLNLRPASASYFGTAPAPLPTWLEWERATRSMRGPAPLAALCTLERVPSLKNGAAFEIRRLSQVQAFTALLTYSYCFSLEDKERKRCMLHAYLNLSRRVPVLEVRYQSALEQLPAVLEGLRQAINQVALESD